MCYTDENKDSLLLEIGGIHLIPFTLIRSRRRTLAIYILPDASVEVRAPYHLSVKAIDAFVCEKQSWIEKKLAFMRERGAGLQKSLQPGDTLPYRGQELPVRLSENGKLRFDGSAFYYPPEVFSDKANPSAVKQAAASLYKRLTLPLIQERVIYYETVIGVQPAAVKVSGATKRWGSCSGKNSLNFSWMLAAADPAALDYVVVHELCHIKEHNHSAAFWRLVGNVLPDYKKRQALLRETEKRLQIANG